MKKLKKTIILIFLIISLILLSTQYVFAAKSKNNIDDYIKKVDFSENFKKWSELSESEKIHTLPPKIYDEVKSDFFYENPLYYADYLRASINPNYNLRNEIPNNISIKNQRDTALCWAFSGLSSLETNLALTDYKNDRNKDKIYDYSERHLNYATTRSFLNNYENIYGFNRNPASGGQWFLVENYLTNGQGAIEENEMPFVNSSEMIEINEINNKNVKTKVNDTIYFDDYNEKNGEERNNIINEIKQHIQSHGSVFATIHGDFSNTILDNCYNNTTGAKYCNDSSKHAVDHAVAIIGWDDNYGIENFSSSMKPKAPGAWIVRNSWGENIEYNLNEFKKQMFNTYPDECKSQGWNSAEQISNSFIESAGYEISGDKVLLPVGDHGYMYISYEDCNVASSLYGIINASEKVDYDYIYQYNELYPAIQITVNTPKTYLCNVFEKKTGNTEYLNEVSLTVPETCTCKVYVNPNGTGKSKADLKPVELKAGESETINIGYHTLEFAEPMEINSEKFAVAVELQGTRDVVDVLMEGKLDGIDSFKYAKTESGKCFVSSTGNLDNCEWFDLGLLHSSSEELSNGDSSLKAFTTTKIEDTSINKIEIETPPTKTTYTEGEDFDKTGMKVRAYFNNNENKILNDQDYNIINGNNLKAGQTSVTIEYLNKSVNQEIKVNAKSGQNPNDTGNNNNNNNGNNNNDNNNGNNNKTPDVLKNSDMSNSYSVVTNVKAYYYTNNSTKNYTLVDVEINGITRNTNGISYEYSYYLSPNKNLTNINDWTEINEAQNNSNKLTFRVDSRDIKNYDEISTASNIYIYIKESASQGGNQSVRISKAMNFEVGNANIETFVDNVKSQDYNVGASNNGGNSRRRKYK